MSASWKPVHNHRERENEMSYCLQNSTAYTDQVKVGKEEEMSSDCSSGCQSGWTMYLVEQSSHKLYNSSQHEEEEEDLSMVSDASSGPPQFLEEDEQHCPYYKRSNLCFGDTGCLYSGSAPPAAVARDGFKKRRVGGEQEKQHSSVLADTAASSPLFSYSKTSFNNNNYYHKKPFMEGAFDFSCRFPYAHLEEKSALQKQLGYLQSFTPLKPTPARPVSRKGGKNNR